MKLETRQNIKPNFNQSNSFLSSDNDSLFNWISFLSLQMIPLFVSTLTLSLQADVVPCQHVSADRERRDLYSEVAGVWNIWSAS